jgi:hypothetical protein
LEPGLDEMVGMLAMQRSVRSSPEIQITAPNFAIDIRVVMAGPRLTSSKSDDWDCPTGKSGRRLRIRLSTPCAKNISLVPSGKSGALSRASRAERGALANVINAARDAVDAEAR